MTLRLSHATELIAALAARLVPRSVRSRPSLVRFGESDVRAGNQHVDRASMRSPNRRSIGLRGIHAVVHVNSKLAPDTTVPIGWIAAGDPAQLFSPDRHDELWRVQEPLDFPGTVYGLPRDATAHERMTRQSTWFGAHHDDRVV